MTELVYLACALLCDEGFTVTFTGESITISRHDGERHVLRNLDLSIMESTPESFCSVVNRELARTMDRAQEKLKP